MAAVKPGQGDCDNCNGTPGPPGPPGPPGSQFVYTQNVPSSTWIIPHNLNELVSVTLLNSFDTIVDADIVLTDLNTTTVMFSTPQTGTAIIIS